MIKAPPELYPGNTDLETLPLSFTPPPTSFLAQFEQLSNLSKYFEKQIEGEENILINTLKPILSVLNQLELFTFDFVALLDVSHREQIQDFFEKNFMMEDDNYSFSLTNSESILSHIKYLLIIIQNISKYFQREQFDGSNLCLGNTEDSLFEEQLSHYLLASSKFFSDVSSLQAQDQDKGLNINCNFKTKIETDSKDFAAWLLNLYKSAPTLQITTLANRLAFRLTTIFDLQESITKMRELCSTSETARENELYDIKSILESENYKLLKERCLFLSLFIKYSNIDILSESARTLACEIEKYGLEYDKNQQTQIEACFKEIHSYDKWIKENEMAVEQMKLNLSPDAKQHITIFSDYLSNLDSSYNSYAFPIAISRCRSNTNISSEKLKKIQNLHSDISRIYDDCVKSAYKIKELEFQVIDLNSKILFYDESSEFRDFKKQTDRLIEKLEYFLRMIKPDNRNSEELIMKMKKHGDTIESIEKKLFDFIDQFNESLKSEAQSYPLPTNLTKQRDDLCAKIKEADNILVNTKKLVYDIKEKKASLGKWSELSTELIGSNVNSVYQSNFQQMEKMIMCPVCKVNYRNRLIEDCGHIICADCFDECISKKPCVCPQCKQPFKMYDYDILEMPKIYGNVQLSKESGT